MGLRRKESVHLRHINNKKIFPMSILVASAMLTAMTIFCRMHCQKMKHHGMVPVAALGLSHIRRCI